MNHRPNPEDHFDHWLDALVAGTSTPASRSASDSVPGDLRDAARQFHGLAHGAEQSPTVPPYPPTWEDFMHAQPASPSPIAHPSIRRAAELVSNGAARPSSGTTPHRPAWDRAFSTALAAVLILAISVGAWRASGGIGGFGNGGDPGNQQQGAFAPDTRVWTPEATGATPEPGVERAALPTAEECTVEPLTVDDVLGYIDDPIGATMNRDLNQPATPAPNAESDPVESTVAPAGFIVEGELVWATPGTEPDPLEATPPAEFAPGPASPAQLAAVADIQRMWMACVLADSPFQRWALESPSLVLEQVMPLLPTFTTADDARQILEAVEAGGDMEPSDDFWRRQPGASYVGFPPDGSGFPTDNTISIIDPATAESWTLDGRTITVGYTSHHDSGNGEVYIYESELTIAGTPIAENTDLRPEFDSCFAFEFTWFPDRAEVLVSNVPHCG